MSEKKPLEHPLTEKEIEFFARMHHTPEFAGDKLWNPLEMKLVPYSQLRPALPGEVLAAWLNSESEADKEHSGDQYALPYKSCNNCGRSTRNLEDGWCESCNSGPNAA